MTHIYRIDFYSKDWLIQTQRLTPEERGVYIQLIAAIYEHQGEVEKDFRYIGNICNCSFRKAQSLVNTLIEKGFLTETETGFTQERALEELNKARARSEKASFGAEKKHENATKNSRKSSENVPKTSRKSAENEPVSNENNCLASANKQSTINSNKLPPCSPPKGGRGERLEIFMGRVYPTHPEGLPSDWGEWAEGKGLNPEQIIHHWQKFLNYWRAKTGSNATKRDWYATWQNWILTELERGTK